MLNGSILSTTAAGYMFFGGYEVEALDFEDSVAVSEWSKYVDIYMSTENSPDDYAIPFWLRLGVTSFSFVMGRVL